MSTSGLCLAEIARYVFLEKDSFFFCFSGKYMSTGHSYRAGSMLMVYGEVAIGHASLVTMKFFKNLEFFQNELNLFQKGLKLKHLPRVFKTVAATAQSHLLRMMRRASNFTLFLTVCGVQSA